MLNSRPCPLRIGTSLVALLPLCASPADAQRYEVRKVENPGSIQGRVFFAGDYPKTKPIRVPGVYRAHCGRTKPNEEFIVSAKSKGLKNAVVYLEHVAAGKPFPRGPAKIEQRECRYEPHVQVVPAGAKLGIVNQDATLHNVHSYFDPDGKRKTLFNLAQPIKGKKDAKTLKDAGLVKVVCDIHRWMSAYIVVRDNPYYAITDSDGGYRISDVPPGSYRLVLWHEGLGQSSKPIMVKAGESTRMRFPIGRAKDDAAATGREKSRAKPTSRKSGR